MSNNWKAAEKQAAEKLGGMKLGGCRRDLPDVITDKFVIEVKYSKNFPLWIKRIFDEAKSKAPSKTPIGYLKPKGMRGGIILIHVDDFQELL